MRWDLENHETLRCSETLTKISDSDLKFHQAQAETQISIDKMKEVKTALEQAEGECETLRTEV